MARINSFEILFDKSPPVYMSGELMTGKVKIKTAQPLFFGLIILPSCEAQVWWNEGNSTFTNKEKYFKNENGILLNINIAQPGEYFFPFSYKLPDNIPTSIESEHCKITYFLELKQNQNTLFKTVFYVVKEFDLNLYDLAKSLSSETDEYIKGCLCCKQGPIKLKINLPKVGYVCGESIDVNLKIENDSQNTINNLELKLIQAILCHSKEDANFEEQVISAKVKETFGNGNHDWTGKLLIPTVPPSSLNSCQIANISYILVATYKIGFFSQRNNVSVGIVIGTKPHSNTGLTNVSYAKSELTNYYKFPLYDLTKMDGWFQKRSDLMTGPYYPFFSF